jgi:hypothetical protein
MRPSSTKSGHIISHSDLSKSAVESDPPHSVGAARACSASIFVFLHFLREALVSVVFCCCGFVDEAARERDRRADKMSARDFQPPCRESVVDTREFEASAIKATETLAAISLASGQSSNNSLSELDRRFESGE